MSSGRCCETAVAGVAGHRVTCHDEVVTDPLVVLDDERHDDEKLDRSGWAGRMLVLGEGRRGSWVRSLGALGAAAFLMSLLVDWQTITMNTPNTAGIEDTSSASVTVGFGVGDQASFGLVYLFGVIGLLAVAGAVLSRPDLAFRLRTGVIGGAVGVLAVLVAITARLDDTIVGIPQGLQALFGNIQPTDGRYKFGYAPGLIFAYAAVVLPAVAIWLAARADAAVPPPRFARHRVVTERTPSPEPESASDVVGPAALPEYQRRRNDGPIDLTVTPG